MKSTTNSSDGIELTTLMPLIVITFANLLWFIYCGYSFWIELQDSPNLFSLLLYLLGMIVGNVIYLVANSWLLGGSDD